MSRRKIVRKSGQQAKRIECRKRIKPLKKTLDPHFKEAFAKSDNCPCCGIPWTEHLGIIGTCKGLLDAKNEIKRLNRELKGLVKK